MVTKKDDEAISKMDLDLVLEVNKKVVEVQLEVCDQNERLIEGLEEVNKINNAVLQHNEYTHKHIIQQMSTYKDTLNEIERKVFDKLEKIEVKIIELDKNQFKIYALLTTGTIAIVLQIIQIVLGLKK